MSPFGLGGGGGGRSAAQDADGTHGCAACGESNAVWCDDHVWLAGMSIRLRPLPTVYRALVPWGGTCPLSMSANS